MGYPIQAIHVPKTVDNDLPITDFALASVQSQIHCGIDTRGEFRCSFNAKTSTKVFVLESNGRHAAG